MRTYCGCVVRRMYTVKDNDTAQRLRRQFAYAVVRVVGDLYQVLVIEE